MKRRIAPILMATFAVVVTGVVLSGANAFAKKPGGNDCPYRFIVCEAVYAPVICSDGNIYSNSCYAMANCQFDCEPYGNGGPFPVE